VKATADTLCIMAAVVLIAGSGAAQVTARVSDAESGGAGNGQSWLQTARWPISSDGRYVAFVSDATDLVSGDTNAVTDVFVRDVELGTTTRVSVALDGGDSNGPSVDPSISADGRYVAFTSSASNLVAGDGNGMPDVFVRDLHLGMTIRVSVDRAGDDANDESNKPSISADGRMVAFGSHATDLVDGDESGYPGIFVRNLDLGQTERVSVAADGSGANGNSWGPVISADGAYVAFASEANNLVANDTGFRDVFLRDLKAHRTIWVSVGRDGESPNEGSAGACVSEHGRYVAFWSRASDLVEGDTNGQDDVFVRDLATGVTSRVNVSSDGAQAVGGGSYHPMISGDGRYVVFMSDAANLVNGDSNGWGDVFAHDRATGTTTLLSVSPTGAQVDGYSRWPAMTPDGRLVVFESTASNLAAGDTNGAMDVYLVAGPAAVPNYVRIFPGAASAKGASTSYWVTDVRLYNPASQGPITVWLSALLRDADNTGAAELPVTVGARKGVAFNDVLATFFGLSKATAAIRMRSTAPFYATSRTYDIGTPGGTFGSFIPSFGPEEALDRGILLQVINQQGGDGFRSNIGFANPGLTASTVTVRVFDAGTGEVIGTGTRNLPPRTFSQIDDVFKFVGKASEAVANATVEFTATTPIFVYASVIDNGSNDPIFVVPCADDGTPVP